MLESRTDKTGVASLFENKEVNQIYRNLIEQLNNFLKDKRKPFLRKQADLLVCSYQNDKVLHGRKKEKKN